MKMKFLKGLVLTAGIFLTALNANAQCKDWVWPEDRKTAEEKNVLYSDAVKAKQFKQAVAPWLWLINNAPNLNSSIYINGAKMYYALANAEKDPAKKKELVDSLLWIHDKRIEVCGQREKVFPRKAFYNYIFNIRNTKDTTNIKQLYIMYEKVFDLLGKNVDQGNAQAYLNVLKVYQLRLKRLSDDEILEKYDRLIGVVDNGVSKETSAKKKEKWETIRASADEMLIGLIDRIADCDFIKEVFVPKFEAEPTNLKYAQWIFKFMLMGKCTDDPVWVQAAKVVYDTNRNSKLAEVLGKKCFGDKDYACAQEYFKQGLELSEDNVTKAEFYVQLGNLERARGRKTASRDYYRKALAANPADAGPFAQIGNLYFGSFKDCAEKTDKAKDRLVYIAAFNMYKKAGNAKLMESAKSQFPSVEELFERNYNKGQTMTVGCWINEAVVLDTRD